MWRELPDRGAVASDVWHTSPYNSLMASERYAVVDVETTGFNSAHDRIVEVACVQVDADRIIRRWTTLVNPGIAIPARPPRSTV